jgi:DNA-binding GntR family transcriptional regulator
MTMATKPARLDSVRQDPSLKEQILASLRSGIIDGRLVAGTLYSVQSLATDLGVSRTPVREALIDLESRGMVRFERNHGVRVLETSVHDLKEILTLRLLLEVPATFRAAEQLTPEQLDELGKLVADGEALLGGKGKKPKSQYERVLDIDRQFHTMILQASGNRRLAEYVDHLRDLLSMRGLYTVAAQRDLGKYLGEHREIYDALKHRDATEAASIMRRHIVDTALELLRRAGDESGELAWAESPLPLL